MHDHYIEIILYYYYYYCCCCCRCVNYCTSVYWKENCKIPSLGQFSLDVRVIIYSYRSISHLNSSSVISADFHPLYSHILLDSLSM